MANFISALRSEVRKAAGRENRRLERAIVRLERRIDTLGRNVRARGASVFGRGRVISLAPDIPPAEVRAFRKGLGLSRHAFADLVGISHGTVYLWEAGRVSPRGFNREKYLVAKRKYGKRAGLPAAALKVGRGGRKRRRA